MSVCFMIVYELLSKTLLLRLLGVNTYFMEGIVDCPSFDYLLKLLVFDLSDWRALGSPLFIPR